MSVTVPYTLADALTALAARPDATILAGGTDLLVELNSGHRQIGEVVVVNRVAELCSWLYDPVQQTLQIGAGVTYAEIERAPLNGWVPALAQAARTVGSPQIRHAATIGGNVGTCSPAGDGLPVLSALDAQVHLASASGTRTISFADFMIGPKRTERQVGELLTGITVPVFKGWQGYSKIGVRNAMVIATVSASLVVDPGTNDRDANVRLALGSVGPVIIRCTQAEALVNEAADFAGGRVGAAVVNEFAQLAQAAARPIDDHRSTAEYRRHAVGVLASRLLRRAFPHE